MAQAAEATNTIMIVSTSANTSLEEIAASTKATLWFQLYAAENDSITESLIERAEKAGYKALVITVDTPFKGNRRRDVANNFEIPEDCKLANFSEKELAQLAKNNNSNSENLYKSVKFSARLNWRSIDWIKGMTKLPIIIKGIINPLDAELAIKHGAAGIVVSNHGGRQLEGVVGTLDALPKIVEVVNKKIPIFIDGGFRSGSDILKAIAMGATAVLLGRPILYALAVDRATELLNYLQAEFKLAMGLMGCESIEQIKKNGLSLIADTRVSPSSNLEKLLLTKISALEEQIKLLLKDHQISPVENNKTGFFSKL